MQDTPDAVVECHTDWYLTEASEQDRARDTGTENADPAREAALLECLKKAA
ncbi:hypothetical protein [Couchioplanes caeruleus]|uniref:Uncharacterized protein n=1 Tax=Couchioplanes caeruleus TaxID=56438 RepID=A0A3N1GSB6_9ACTN|nr:hypothetical protein [Couchioplanes caeruleus]ROP33016.1 hypothetical protein EDD30_5982 [Couchioplanes caeruleus]